MDKQRHWFIMSVWAVALIAAVVLFKDQLLPAPGAAPDRNTSPGQSAEMASSAGPVAGPEASGSPQERLHKAMLARNPRYNGNAKFLEEGGRIVVADLSATGIVDVSPVSQLPLNALDLKDNPVSDLAPLRSMALNKLALENTKVTDLAPLKGMPLAELYLNNTPVRDISPLKGLPLKMLNLYGTSVEDITPLEGMPLESLWLNGTRVKDISPLHGCPLVSLTLERTPVADLSPLAGGKLERLHISQSAVTDLTPIKALRLTRLIFTPGRIKQGMEVVRNMQSIHEIGTTLDGRMPPERFWNLYDQGNVAEAP